MLEEEDRLRLKQAIAQELEKLKHTATQMEDVATPIAPDNSLGRLTRMEALNEQGVREANLRKAKGRIASLTKAMKRLEEDEEYGLCHKCEEPIPVKRLVLMPESRMCVPCASGL